MDDPTTYRPPRPFRSILHGTCLLGGKHPAGSQLARECPVYRRERRAQRQPQEPSESEAATTLQAPPKPPSQNADNSATFETPNRYTEAPLAEARRRLWKTNGFGGRPRVPLAEQHRKARVRVRRHRAGRRPGAATP